MMRSAAANFRMNPVRIRRVADHVVDFFNIQQNLATVAVINRHTVMLVIWRHSLVAFASSATSLNGLARQPALL